jgi:hypothetical protein
VAEPEPVGATAWVLLRPFAVVGSGSPERTVALPECMSRHAVAPPGSSRHARLSQGARGSCFLQIASMPEKKKLYFVKVIVEFNVIPSVGVSCFKDRVGTV